MLKLGTVSLDGTKVHANASRQSAMNYGHAKNLEASLTAEVAELMKRAGAANAKDFPEGLNRPEALSRREQRLAAITAATARISQDPALDCVRRRNPSWRAIRMLGGARRNC